MYAKQNRSHPNPHFVSTKLMLSLWNIQAKSLIRFLHGRLISFQIVQARVK